MSASRQTFAAFVAELERDPAQAEELDAARRRLRGEDEPPAAVGEPLHPRPSDPEGEAGA